ncbi:MAG: hypothetical protein DPW18_16125 [Chloroflexi bacterium]|nr:hypothetical protein [Chloroflexota bacterium]MDL1944950.1 efflux RND transporter periplasmic adaptor subunit [Chloroflexi bacterium CFX2]
MKRLFILLSGLLALAACASPTPAASAPTAAPGTDAPVFSADVVVASAKVEPAHLSELGFTIPALAQEIPVSEGDEVNTGDVLMTLNTPDLEYAALAAEADYNARALAAELQKAERVKYVNPNTGYIRWYPIPREVYEKALSKAEQAKAVWESAAASLAQGTLLAPFDGTIVDVRVIPGEWVQVNQPVIVLADLSSLQVVTTDLSERDIVRVKIGQSANVYIEALDLTAAGRVVRISPIAETVGGDVVFPVTIALDDQPEGLLWGMSVEVEIQTK